MLDWRSKFAKVNIFGQFIDPTMHCRGTPDVWQVGINFTDKSEKADAQQNQAYFLVRWRPPYRFRMVAVSDKPSPDCTERDRRADDEKRLLFPVQEWR
jgi:hypothetical protein